MLTIEKVVKLVHPDLLALLKAHFSDIKATYPLRLITQISTDCAVTQDSDELCMAVYGNIAKKTKQKFFQLAHHTFKLTAFLSRNYNTYLYHNLSAVQHCINNGRLQSAQNRMYMVLDIAEKIGDHSTQIGVLTMIANDQMWREQYLESVRTHERIGVLQREQQAINDIYTQLRQFFNPKNKGLNENSDLNEQRLADILRFFEQYFTHECVQLRCLSRYAYYFALQQYHAKDFFSEEVLAQLIILENDIRKNEVVVFPYLEDFQHKIAYLKLRVLMYQVNTDEMLAEAQQMIANSEQFLFWKSYIPAPTLFAAAVQTSYYVTNYLYSYRADYQQFIPKNIQKQIEQLRQRCATILANDAWKNQYIIRQINLRIVYSGLLMIGNSEQQLQATQLLEETLIVYQQVPFHAFLDGIFANLLCCYFCLGDHEKVASSYKRYKKITEGKAVNPENDLTLHGFYYLSQLLATDRKQYREKFAALLTQFDAPNLQAARRLLLDIAAYNGLNTISLEHKNR
jgi:hypothetical protein